jgi:hypothetical protein
MISEVRTRAKLHAQLHCLAKMRVRLSTSVNRELTPRRLQLLGKAWSPAGEPFGVRGSFVNYPALEFFHSNGGSSKLPEFRRYVLACAAALSFPCSISSTGSEGAIQFFAVTLYTDACTPCALCSENNRRCSPPTLTSAQTPWSNIEETPGKTRFRGAHSTSDQSIAKAQLSNNLTHQEIARRCQRRLLEARGFIVTEPGFCTKFIERVFISQP